MSLCAGELQVVAGTGPAVASAKVRGADASMIMGFEVFLPYYLEAIHYFKNNKSQTIAILKKYAKSDLTTLDSAHAYLKNAIPDMPYPTLEGMKTILAEMARTLPEVLKHDAATMVDRSIVKATEDEGFLQKLKSN